MVCNCSSSLSLQPVGLPHQILDSPILCNHLSRFLKINSSPNSPPSLSLYTHILLVLFLWRTLTYIENFTQLLKSGLRSLSTAPCAVPIIILTILCNNYLSTCWYPLLHLRHLEYKGISSTVLKFKVCYRKLSLQEKFEIVLLVYLQFGCILFFEHEILI